MGVKMQKTGGAGKSEKFEKLELGFNRSLCVAPPERPDSSEFVKLVKLFIFIKLINLSSFYPPPMFCEKLKKGG